MAKLLMITYKYPPMKSIGAVRTFGFSKSIRRFFDEVIVITTNNRHKVSDDLYDLDGMNILDVPTIDYRTIFNRKNNDYTSISESTKTNKIYKNISKLKSSYPTNLLLGEGGFIYIYFALRKASSIIKKEKITHIFSSFSPFSDHFIASKLKIKFPNLFWIADFRDLHVDPITKSTYLSNYQHRINRNMLQHADIITTVSEGLAHHLREYHNNIYILRNGIIPRSFPSIPIQLFDKFTITYTGSMFADKRNPDLLLKLIQDLINENIITERDFQFIYAGKDGGWWARRMEKFGLSSVFVNYGNIIREEAKHLQRSSHMNLLLTYTSDDLKGNLTGKVYEYIASNRPIITIINGPFDNEMEKILSHDDYLIGSTLQHDFNKKLRMFIIGKINEWNATRNVAFIPNDGLIKQLSWPVLISKFGSYLNMDPVYD